MCAIVGIYSFNKPGKRRPDECLDAMIKTLSHRGPDNSGKYVEPGLFMGHTRLAVIDVSSLGHQPMLSHDKRLVICYNGEIYNFREIRSELISCGRTFISNSDTEVLLHAWQQWGEAALDRIDGMFAFAIFDRQKRTLFLVRDHLGIKPLFYTLRDGEVFFASEPLAMFGKHNTFPNVDVKDIDMYFTFNYLPAPQTGLDGVCQVRPGHIVTITDSGAAVKQYWRPNYHDDVRPYEQKHVEEFSDVLFQSVCDQMVSDVPLGVFLSGGLDSLSVSAAAASISGSRLASFTLGFRQRHYDESPAAASYADFLSISNDRVLFEWTGQEIAWTLEAMTELLADASCFPVYQLCRFARKKVTVALSGDGGDELLAGYDTYKAGAVIPYLRALPGAFRDGIKVMARYLPSDNRRYGLRMVVERLLLAAEQTRGRDHASFRRIFTDDMKRRIYQPDFYRETAAFDPIGQYAQLMDEVPQGRSYLTARQHADMIFHLPGILAKVDRMSMAHALEVRVPLLSRKMVELCINLPDEAKRYGGKGKRIMRKAIVNQVPRNAMLRPKAGFLPPVDRWFRYPGPMLDVFQSYLNTAMSKNLELLDWDKVGEILKEHREGRIEAGFVLLGILQYINWRLKCLN